MSSTPYSDTRLEMVVVCLNYADFLAETLPINLTQVDRLVVVTSHEDERTRALCTKWSVECVVTDLFQEKGERFNKGAAINIGLGALRQRGWIMQVDADIVLPVSFRNMLDKFPLRKDGIHGCERCNVVGWPAWTQIKSRWFSEPQFGYRYMVSTPAEAPVGANVIHKQYGYVPIGFFQLWHASYMHRYDLRYPETEGSAENTDVQWALRWPRAQRHLVPTFRVYHLESEPAPMGVNWGGRKSCPFGPEMPSVDPPFGYGSGVH